MKRRIMRSILVLLLLGCSLASRADVGTIFSENFNAFSSVNMNTTSCEGWTLSNCLYGNGNVNSNSALKINEGGYAITPVLSRLSGEADLSFKFSKVSNTDYDYTFTVSIIGGASFEGDKSSLDITIKSRILSQYSVKIIGGTAETQIKFQAKSGQGPIYIDDVILTAEYVAAPVFSLAEGYYKTAQTLTMSCETAGTTVRYTTDGSEPTAESTSYTAPLSISEPVTIKAKAFKGDLSSSMTMARYYIGDYIYADAFTNETNGYHNLSNDFSVQDLAVGRSAILSFRMFGRAANNSSLTLNVTEYYQQENVQGLSTRAIVDDVVLYPEQNVWTTATYPIPVLHDGATITIRISGSSVNLDDVLLVKPPVITLNENGNNAQTLTDNLGKIVDVETSRTLRAGIWNTLCLPFAVSNGVLNEAFGEGQTPAMRTYDSYDGHVMTFVAVGNNTIPAGEPFLLHIDKGCVNPTFHAVKIEAATPGAIPHGAVTFQGIFSQTSLNTDGSDLFVGTDNYLYQPAASTSTMGGLRAYIHRINGARISLAVDGSSTAVECLEAETPQSAVAYTLQGLRTTVLHRGIYVVDGKKVVVKK
jgi:hypothetical protein